MSETQIFTSHLLEKWIINQRKKIIEEYEDCTEDLLESRVKSLALQSLFLLKRQSDPGFRTLVYTRIKEGLNKNNNLFKTFRKKILSFIKTIQFLSSLKIENSNRKSWLQRIDFSLIVLENQISSYPLTITSVLPNTENKVNFLTDLMDTLQKKGEYKYLIATKTVIKEILTGIDQSSECFTSIDQLKPSITYEKYRLLMIKFMVQEINFKILDHYDAERNNIFLTQNINLNFDLLGNPLSEITDEFYGLIKDSIDIENKGIDLDKYQSQPIGIIYTDILTILSLIYWNQLEEIKKIKLLNKFYGLGDTSSYIRQNQEIIDPNDFTIIINQLFKYHYFSECKSLLIEYIQRKRNNLSEKQLKILRLDLIYVLMELREKKTLKAKFKQYFPKITENLPPNLDHDNESFSYDVLYKWSEFLYINNELRLLDKIVSFFKSKKDIIEEIESKRNILIFLGRIERLRKDFSAESDYLNEALTDIWESEVDYDSLNRRIKDYEAVNFDFKEIENYDNEKKIYDFIEIALESQLMGDFDHSRQVLSEISAQLGDLGNEKKYEMKFFEAMVFPLIYGENFDEALKLLHICLEINPDDYYLKSYFYLIHLKLDNMEILKEISHPDIHSNLKAPRLFLRNIINFLGKEKFRQICNNLLSFVNEADQVANNVLDIANILADLGFFSLSLDFYKYGLRYIEKDSIKSQIFNGIGTVYINLNKDSKAIEYLQKAIQISPNNKTYYENLSMAYHLIPDYSEAKKAIKKAIEIAKNQNLGLEELILLYHKYLFIQLLLTGIPSINKVQYENTKALFKHAFLLDKNVYRHLSEISKVANSIFNAYSNALDSLLHNVLSGPFLKVINKKYSKKNRQKYSSSKRKMDIGIYHLSEGDHLTLPQWKILLSKLKSKRTPPKLIDFKKCLPNLNKDQYDILFETVDLLNQYRIPSVHGQITTFESYMKERNKIITKLNKIIDFFKNY